MTDAARGIVASHPVPRLFMPYRPLPCAAAQRSAIGCHLFTAAHCVLLHASFPQSAPARQCVIGASTPAPCRHFPAHGTTRFRPVQLPKHEPGHRLPFLTPADSAKKPRTRAPAGQCTAYGTPIHPGADARRLDRRVSSRRCRTARFRRKPELLRPARSSHSHESAISCANARRSGRTCIEQIGYRISGRNHANRYARTTGDDNGHRDGTNQPGNRFPLRFRRAVVRDRRAMAHCLAPPRTQVSWTAPRLRPGA